MTTVTSVPMSSSEAGQDILRPKRYWRRLGRLTWLQHRAAFFSFGALSIAFVAIIIVELSRTSGSYSTFVNAGCTLHTLAYTDKCNTDALALGGSADFRGIGLALSALPALVGVFVGAPLVSHEFESGTFRFAWTQSIGRTRYLGTKLAVLAVAVSAMAVTLGLVFSGTYAHLYEVVLAPDFSQWQVTLFATTWWMLAAATLFALAVGSLLGVLIKRTVASMATTLGIVGALIVAARGLLPTILGIGAQVSSRFPIGNLGIGAINNQAQAGSGMRAGTWVVRSWLTGPSGNVLNAQTVQNVTYELAKLDGSMTTSRWLSLHHYRFWVAYQPESHFWMVQGAIGIILIALASGCAFLALRVVRPRIV
jgi:ABC-type transport system involved in multi-copper enzyme maturation permease subunit